MNRPVRARRLVTAPLLLAVMVAGSLALTTYANAEPWTSGRNEFQGYFGGVQAGGGEGNTGAIIDNNQGNVNVIPRSVDTPAEFYSFLYDKYRHAGNPAYAVDYGNKEWDRIGVSFIVNALLQRGGPNAHKSLGDADWSELRARMLQPGVTIDGNQLLFGSNFGGIDDYYSNTINDVVWYANANNVGEGFMIRFNGRVVAALFYKCANFLGDEGGLPPVQAQPAWSVTPTVGVTRDEAAGTITWTHAVTNNGPDALDTDVSYRYQNGGDLGTGSDTFRTFPSGQAAGKGASYQSTIRYTSDDAGKTFCRATTAYPSSSTNPGPVTSEPACVTISRYFHLYPMVTFDGAGTRATVTTGGQPVTVTPSVNNTGPTASSSAETWLTRCSYAPGAAYPTQTDSFENGQTATQTFGTDRTCRVVSMKTQQYPVRPSQLDPVPADTAGATVGAHICYILSVRPPNERDTSAGTWRHSAPACISVRKIPTIQALGADIRAGSVRTAQPQTLGGKKYGSWAEYGIFGIGGISGMASSAGFVGGAPVDGGTSPTALTFANTPSAGNYYPAPTAGDVATAYAALATETTATTSRGGPIADGMRQVIVVNGDLTITADMTYDGSYASAADIPRVIYVVSGNITVDAGVTRIDPWLITKGTLFTCDGYTGTQQLTVGDCNKPLTFTGSVTAAKAVLGRTFGADDTTDSRGAAAETFSLSPNGFLSGYSASLSAVNIETVYEKELPPRY